MRNLTGRTTCTFVFLFFAIISNIGAVDFGIIRDVRPSGNISIRISKPGIFKPNQILFVYRDQQLIGKVKTFLPSHSSVTATPLEIQDGQEYLRNDIVVANQDDIALLQKAQIPRIDYQSMAYETFAWICSVQIISAENVFETQTRKFSLGNYIMVLNKKNDYYAIVETDKIDTLTFLYKNGVLSGSTIGMKQAEELSVLEIIAPGIQKKINIPAEIQNEEVTVTVKLLKKKEGLEINPHHIQVDVNLKRPPPALSKHPYLLFKLYVNGFFSGELVLDKKNLLKTYFFSASYFKNGKNEVEFLLTGAEKKGDYYFEKGELLLIGKKDFFHDEKTPSARFQIESRSGKKPEIIK